MYQRAKMNTDGLQMASVGHVWISPLWGTKLAYLEILIQEAAVALAEHV